MSLHQFSDGELDRFRPLREIHAPPVIRTIAGLLEFAIFITLVILLTVPWVQTAYGPGKVISLNPNDRPQPINALVSGRIKKWYVEDGSMVKAGEPLLEIVDNDADFVERLQEQRDALARKVEAAEIGVATALLDLDRQRELYEKGLSSKRTYEQAKIAYNAKRVEESKAIASFNKAKVALARQEVQILRAPRDGMIVEIMAGDNATTVKSGEKVAMFVPTNFIPAVELYVDGFDVPLIEPGRKVRLQFEGWPVVQFSGWPSKAIGTFGGVVNRIDPSISPNGRFRIIVVEDPADQPWPDQRFLRLGAKVKGWVLLETVKLGFELWRNLNNFPPEFPRLKEQSQALAEAGEQNKANQSGGSAP